jgi:pimeloyl-ACP methyl ester carboxylesterase
VTGRLDTKSIQKAVAGGGGAESKNVEAQQAGQLPPGWRATALRRFQKFRAPLLLIYGTADPTTGEALSWYREHCQSQPHVHMVEGANHSYYGLAWEQEVVDVTLRWLNQLQGAAHGACNGG